MALPERANSATSPSPSNTEIMARLAETNRQLEVADENENPTERFFKRDRFLEEQIWLEAELEKYFSISETNT